MGDLAETQLVNAIDALRHGNSEMAACVIEHDKKIDALETEIETYSVNLIALRQPMADDLRGVIAALKVSGNIERIGDYAKNIAKRTITLAKTPSIGASVGTIARMGVVVEGMIKNVLDAYVRRDADMADDVRLRDQEVDQIHSSLFRELLTYMMEDPRNIGTCTHLLFIATTRVANKMSAFRAVRMVRISVSKNFTAHRSYGKGRRESGPFDRMVLCYSALALSLRPLLGGT